MTSCSTKDTLNLNQSNSFKSKFYVATYQFPTQSKNAFCWLAKNNSVKALTNFISYLEKDLCAVVKLTAC